MNYILMNKKNDENDKYDENENDNSDNENIFLKYKIKMI